MKISKTSLLLFGLLFCGFTVDCNRTNGDDKIKLKIEVLNTDELLSPSHLKVQKNIVHNGKKINMKMFEKIDGQVLERALIVEEIDKTRSLSNSQKKELLSLRRSEDDSEEDTTDEDMIVDIEDHTEEDGKMKITSSEESKENDIHMIRKIYKETLGNKEITYCYMIFTFNLDLEKLNEVSRSELFKSLDSMPDYLSFLSPKEEVSDTENLLEEEYEQLQNDSGNHSSFSGMSATELSHDSEDMEVNIAKYITTLDDIINYVVSKSEDVHKLPAFYHELLREREYLYKLSLERTENENVADEEYWKNKPKVDKYFLYEALTHLKNFFFDGMNKRADYNELKGDDNFNDASIEYKKFNDLTDKTIKCHALLDTTEILDFVVLQNMENVKLYSENENKTDKELIEQCVTLFRLLLNDKEDIIELIRDRKMNHSNIDIESQGKEEKGTSMRDNRKTFNELENIAEEKFPARRYMLRKEAPENDEIIRSLEDDESTENDYSSQGIHQELDDSIIDGIGEADELYEDPEEEFTNEMISDMPEEEFTDEMISDMPEEEFTDNMISDMAEEERTDEISSDILEKKHKMNHINFLEYDNKISNGDIATEMFNEDTDIANETEEEHQAEILEVLNLEKKNILKDDMNKTIDSTEESAEELTGEITSDAPEMEYKQNLTSSIESDDEESKDAIATQMFNEDTDIANETEAEHKAEILEVLNLEKEKVLNDEMNSTEERSIRPHNEMTSSSYLENESMVDDDDDDDDDDESIFSADDINDEDMFSVDNDNEDAFEEKEDETNFDQDDEEEDDGDDDDGNSLDEDILEDDEEEDDDPNEKFTDKLKRKAKKGLKNVLNKGKDMAQNALGKLVDKAEKGVKEFASKTSNKIKSKLNSKKDKKKAKKSKKNANKKNVKKSDSKGIKKDKKKGKKNGKSKGDNLRTLGKPKKGKSPKAMSSLETQDMSTHFENSNMENSYIDLTDASTKEPLGPLMNKIMNDYKTEKASLKRNGYKPSREIEEPMASDKEVVKTLKNYSRKGQDRKGKNFKRAMPSLETQDMSTNLENSNMENSYIDLTDASTKEPLGPLMNRIRNDYKTEKASLKRNGYKPSREIEEPMAYDKEVVKTLKKNSRKGQDRRGSNFKKAMPSLEAQDMSTNLENSNVENSYIDLTDASSKEAANGRIKHIIENIKEEMSNLKNNKKILLKELEEPTVSDKNVIKAFEKYSQKEQKKREKRLKN